ncbi:MAG: AAA family ATPase [Thermoplasmata archaeon]
MEFYVILRGPLGVGKTTFALRVAKEVGAEYLSIDRILDDHHLWNEGRRSEFLRANTFAVELATASLARGAPVVLDGNFYWKSVIDDLIRRLPYRHYVFTLDAPLAVCIERDRRRERPHGSDATRAVYAKSTAFHYGIKVDASGSIGSVLRDLRTRLPTRENRVHR